MRHFTAAIALLFVFSSCKENSDNSLTVYRAADEGLQLSIKNMHQSSQMVYHELKDKLYVDESKIAASVWQPVGMEIKKLSDSMVLYLQGLRSELISETGMKDNDIREGKWETDLSVTDHVFSSHGKGRELFEKMLRFKQTLFAIHPSIKNKLENSITIFSNKPDSEITDPAKFTKTFFRNIPAIAATVMLSKFENNIRIIENRLAMFCLVQIPIYGYIFDNSSPIVSQSSTCLKSGELLQIYTVIDDFTTITYPEVEIDKTQVRIDKIGVAVYEIKVPLKAGRYLVPVKIDYIHKDGRKINVLKDISYTVVE